jgi:hypothetical protein
MLIYNLAQFFQADPRRLVAMGAFFVFHYGIAWILLRRENRLQFQLYFEVTQFWRFLEASIGVFTLLLAAVSCAVALWRKDIFG